MILSGAARLAGVMGWPVRHSRSPRIHGYWLEKEGIDGAYIPLAVRPEALGQALAALPALGFRGCNLTLPHKEAALVHLDSLSVDARRIGAVNIVTVGEDGTLHGHNTDGEGFLAHLRDAAPDWAPEAPVMVLGAGGAARAAVSALVGAGVARLTLANRNAARAETLAAAFGDTVRTVPWEDREEALEGCGLLVNATSLGMTGSPPLALALAALPAHAVVYDLVYAPLETALLCTARARGNKAVDGLGMLLHQARPGFMSWFGASPRITSALRAFVAEGL